MSPATHAAAPGPAILQLTDDRASDVRPAWSPDNRTIAYQSNREGPYHIYLMNADGTNQRALTKGDSDDRHPVWMPDGKSILFDSWDGQQREIWSINVANGNRTRVTRIGALANFPAPSPDGQWMTFYVFKNEVLNLWKARISGSDANPLTTELATADSNQCTFACHRAAWSQDSRAIAYSAGELDTIWMIAGEGAASQKVVADGEDNHFPWFLPDGRLGYVTEHIEPSSAWTDAWALDLKTGQRSLLQGRMSMQGPVEWSNDQTKILFHSPRAGNFDIYLIDLNALGGLNALQGTRVPVERAPNTTPAAVPVTATPTFQVENILILGLGIGFASMVAAGLIFWTLRRRG